MKRIDIRYIDIVAGLAIDEQGHIVVVDSVSPSVFRMTENGQIVKWFDCSERMREPSDLAILGREYYICDFKVRHPCRPFPLSSSQIGFNSVSLGTFPRNRVRFRG